MTGWSAPFPEPIYGLENLRQAANHITKLPKAEQAKPHWQHAVEHLSGLFKPLGLFFVGQLWFRRCVFWRACFCHMVALG
jgi:hypothetical protein